MSYIHFHRLYGENIGTYAGKFALDLDSPGLNLLLGASGSGKSTMWRLLSMLLFAEIEGSNRQQARNDLFHPVRAKKAFGAVDLSVGGVRFTIARAKKHPEYGNGMLIRREGKDWTNYTDADAIERVRSLVGVTYHQFTTSIYLPQRTSHMMIRGSDTERWRFVTKLAGCAPLDAAADRVRSWNNSAEASAFYTATLEAMGDIESRLRAAGSTRVFRALRLYLQRKTTPLVRRRKEALRVLKQHEQADAVEKDRAELRARIGEKPESIWDYTPAQVKEVFDLLVDRLNNWQLRDAVLEELSLCPKARGIAAVREEFERCRRACVELNTLSRVQAEQLELIQAADEHESEGVCYVCGQTWPESERRKAILRIEATLADIELDLKRQRKQKDKLHDEGREAQRQRRLRYEIPDVKGSPRLLRRRLAVVRILLARVSRHHEKLSQYKNIMDRLRTLPEVERPDLPVDEALEIVKSTEDKLLVLRDRRNRLDELQHEQSWLATEKTRAQVSFEDASSQYRKAELHQVTEEAIRELKHRRVTAVTEALLTLASKHYPSTRAVHFEADLGPRKFGIKLRRKDRETGNEFLLPARLLSGGEEDEAAVAFTFAIQELASADVRSNLLVLDESGSHMDDRGLSLMIEKLTDLHAGKTVFVVSHRATAKEAPVWDRIFETSRKGGVSSIRQLR